MTLFGLEIRRAQRGGRSAKAPRAISRPTYASPFGRYLSGYVPLEVDPELYRILREAFPILDVAITRLTRLLGHVVIEAPDPLVGEIEEFLQRVRVNASQRGFNAFLNNHVGSMLQYGKAVGEIVPDGQRRDIYALVNLDSRTVRLIPRDPPLELTVAQQQPGQPEPVPIPEEVALLNLYNPEGDSPHGVSLFRSLPFVAHAVLTIENAVQQTWERMGAPSYQVLWHPPENFIDVEGTKTAEVMAQIEDNFTRAMQQRKNLEGVADFFAAGDIEIKVIGPEGPSLDFQAPYRALTEQIVARTGLPPYMLGLQWSTTERLSQQQADMIIAEIKDIRTEIAPTVERVIDLWLRLTGRRGQFRVGWSEVTLQDLREEAEAAYRQAIARRLEIQNAIAMEREGWITRLEAARRVDPNIRSLAREPRPQLLASTPLENSENWQPETESVVSLPWS